jgi:hypothetical protein
MLETESIIFKRCVCVFVCVWNIFPSCYSIHCLTLQVLGAYKAAADAGLPFYLTEYNDGLEREFSRNMKWSMRHGI